MRVGKLRHKGEIQSCTETPDSFGEPTKGWVKLYDVWCDIKPLNGTEKYVSAEKHATSTHQVIIRYSSGISPKMRLVSRGRTFEIKSAFNVNEKDRMMQLIVEEQVND